MDREKTDKKSSDIVPVKEGPAWPGRVGETWVERDLDAVFNDFRRSVDDMMRPFLSAGFPDLVSHTRYAPIDIVDEGDHYQLKIELPGFARDEVEVQINNDGMGIRAKKETIKDEKSKNYVRRERGYSTFERRIAFPKEVDPERAQGSMKDGILELKIFKKEPTPESKMRKIEIQ